MKKTKVSAEEPAPRVVKMILSVAEVMALSNYHLGHMKRLTNQVGKTVMGGGSFFAKGPAMRLASQQIKAHKDRANEILSLALESVKEQAGGLSIERVNRKRHYGGELPTPCSCGCAAPELKGNGIGDYFIECPLCHRRSLQERCEDRKWAVERWNSGQVEGAPAEEEWA